jgi:dienelactone hydrolase
VDFTDDVSTDSLRTRAFTHLVDGRSVPGLLFTHPTATHPQQVVLIGHGASSSKREGYVTALARQFVRHGLSACAIDGPVHGDRRHDGVAQGTLPFLEFSQLWASDLLMTDHMVADWRGVLDAIVELPEIADGPVGYWGVSMGTILGLPLVAAEPRIRAAVLGLMGLVGPTEDRLRLDAERLSCPVHFLVQWDDQLFPRDLTFKLFDAVGSTSKVLVASPGNHGDVPTDSFVASAQFLIHHLTKTTREVGR